VPVRGDVEVFASTSKATVPLPVPLPPDVILNQEALLIALQLQAEVTLAELDPAAAGRFRVVGLTLYVHELPPWMTVSVSSAIVKMPVRDTEVGFTATVKPTVPLPLPLVPEVMVTQATLLVEVHPQPAVVDTVPVPVVPLPGDVKLFGETLKLQLPCWVTVTVCPATVSVPVRIEEEVFAVKL
jgi:hypothetical protein